MKAWLKKIDKLKIGVVVGLVLPVISFLIYAQVKYSYYDFGQLFDYMMRHEDNRHDLLIFPVLPNMALFYFANYQLAIYRFTQGLVGVTIMVAVFSVICLFA